MTDQTESCGRCGASGVVGRVGDQDGDGDEAEDGTERDPFGGARIEVPEDRMRVAAAPSVLAGRAKRRPDEAVARFVYGR